MQMLKSRFNQIITMSSVIPNIKCGWFPFIYSLIQVFVGFDDWLYTTAQGKLSVIYKWETGWLIIQKIIIFQ